MSSLRMFLPVAALFAPSVALAAVDSAGDVRAPVAAGSNEPWWLGLDDPALTELIEESLQANFNLAAARDRVSQADAIAMQSRSSLLPSVSFDVNANSGPYEPQPWQSAIPGLTTPNAHVMHSGSAMLVAGLQVDIFGRSYTSTRAAYLEANASEGDRDALALTTAAMVAQSYYDVVVARARFEVVRQQVEVSTNLLALVEARLERGAANALDVLQQRQQVQSTRANLPLAEVAVEIAERQLNVLLGRQPDADLPQLASALPDAIAVDADANLDLLKLRPDLRAADERLRAAECRSKSAFRGLLPSLRLSGQLGYQATYIDGFDADDTWAVAAGLSVPIFEGFRSWGALQQAEAAESAARNALTQTRLQAQRDLENALARVRAQQTHLQASRAREAAAQQTLEEARSRYLNGLSVYVNVLSALNGYYSAQLLTLGSERDQVGSVISLYQTAGGAFTEGLGTRSRSRQ